MEVLNPHIPYSIGIYDCAHYDRENAGVQNLERAYDKLSVYADVRFEQEDYE